jgi:AAA ATPase domain
MKPNISRLFVRMLDFAIATDKTNTPQYLKTIPALALIYDRSQELDLLKQWILTEKSRSILISGAAGIGKTILARQLLEDIKDEFEEIVWQSLGCQRAVVECIDRNLIASLKIDALPEPPLDLEARLSLLLEHNLDVIRCSDWAILFTERLRQRSGARRW